MRAPSLDSSDLPPPSASISTASLGSAKLKTSQSSSGKKKKIAVKEGQVAPSIPVPTLVGFGMQNSLNRFTDIFEQSSQRLPESGSSLRLSQAVRQSHNEDLSENDRISLVNIFMRNRDVVTTYIALNTDEDRDFRCRWIEQLLKDTNLLGMSSNV